MSPNWYGFKIDCLLGFNVIIERNSVIKASCIGLNSKIYSGTRITRCIILDNVVIGDCCVLNGYIAGSHSYIGDDSVLRAVNFKKGTLFLVKPRLRTRSLCHSWKILGRSIRTSLANLRLVARMSDSSILVITPTMNPRRSKRRENRNRQSVRRECQLVLSATD